MAKRLFSSWCILTTCNRVARSQEESSPADAFDYYDRLRTDPSLTSSVSPPSNTSNVFLVEDTLGNEFRLADVSCFLPFTNGTGPEAAVRVDVENDAFAALLATYEFNRLQTECNVRLTTELFDTSFNPISSTRNFTDVLQRTHSLETPLPSAVVGAYRSATTSPLAILSGVNDIAQVSYASTSADFEVVEQYPYFGRVCASSDGDAQVAVDLFASLGYTHVGVLFVTDAFGSAFQKAFQDAASAADPQIVTESVAFSFSADPEGDEIVNAVASLNNTQIRVFFAICFEDHYVPIMTAAYNMGLVGGDYLWIFPGFQTATFHRSAVFEPGSPLVEATRGIGIMEFSGGLVTETTYPGAREPRPLEENPLAAYDQFRKLWREALEDEELVAYFKSRLPKSLDNVTGFDRDIDFSPEPGQFGALVFDAILALGYSMCHATNPQTKQPVEFFSGSSVYEVFRNLDMQSASGNVRINNETGTRDFRTLTYTILNAQEFDELDENGKVQFKLVPTNYYNDTWRKVEGNPFVFADGSTTPPDDLPPVDMDLNQIGDGGQIVGYSLMAVVLFCAAVSLLWMIWYRNMAVVRQSQPLFLFMVSLGTFVMASTIIPLSMEEPVENLDTACMASPWVYLSGAIVAFSALFAKTRGIYMAYKNPDLDKILVTPMDIFVTFSVVFGVNLIIMITWTLVAPLEWDRVVSGSTDIFNRPTESYGTCSNDDSLAFVIVVLVLNMGILVVANYQAYQSRNIETEYNESRYIGIAMAAFLQAWCMGIPILIVVWDKPQAKFFVESGIIFVTALAVLLLIYVPKMRAIRKEYKRELEESRLKSYRDHQARSRKMFDDSESFSKSRSEFSTSSPTSGAAPAVAAHWGLSISAPASVKEPSALTEDSKAEEDHSAELNPPNVAGVNGVEDRTGSKKQDGVHVHFDREHASTASSPEHKSQTDASTASSPEHKSQTDEHRGGFDSPIGESGQSPSRRHVLPPKIAESVRSFKFGPLPVKSDGANDSAPGIRITHNPRSRRNLELGMGQELSRAQVEVIGLINEEGGDDSGIIDEEKDEANKLESAIAPGP